MDHANAKMSSIEERLTKVEETLVGSNSSSTPNVDLKEYQAQLLIKLKGIREAMTAEGGDIVQIKEERDKLAIENTKQKKESDKLNYRIKHLIKALNREEAKQQ